MKVGNIVNRQLTTDGCRHVKVRVSVTVSLVVYACDKRVIAWQVSDIACNRKGAAHNQQVCVIVD